MDMGNLLGIDLTQRYTSMMQCVYKIGELFAGAGGMALGAQNTKEHARSFEHVWANDMDKDACTTFQANIRIPSDQVICCNVQDLNFSRLSPIDGLLFGFPCNDFSVVGERNGINGEYGKLYQWGEKALKHFQPLFFVAENVSGLGSGGKDSDLCYILNAFRMAGYSVVSEIYRFEEYGVPQRRHRIIIVGFREELNIQFSHPSPTYIGNPVTAKDALANIPENALNNEFTNHPPHVIERLGYIKPGENVFTANIPYHLQLKMNSGAKISQIYRRLHPEKPSYTVTGSGGGGTHLYHWEEPRALTNRERARLQAFPDSFHFHGGKESVRKQIGMAVPSIGAEVVLRAVMQALIANDVQPKRFTDGQLV